MRRPADSHPRRVGIKELKDQASSLVDGVERRGEVIQITKNGRPVAKLIPIPKEAPPVETFDERAASLGLVLSRAGRGSLGEYLQLEDRPRFEPAFAERVLQALREDRDAD